MRTTARRRPIERASLARRCVALIAIAAVSLGCVADTFSYSGVAPVPIAAGAGPVEPNPAPVVGSRRRRGRRRRPCRPSPIPRPCRRSRSCRPPNATATVPILYYHRVQAIPTDYPSWSAARKRRFTTYDVLPAAFAAQLDWLFLHGYTTILPRDLAAHWDQGTPLPERPVIISFDDGSRDWVRKVLPLLKARGMVAEFYLTLDAIKNGNLTWKEVRRLAAAGNGIGAHDVHHVQLAGARDRVTPRRRRTTMWARSARSAGSSASTSASSRIRWRMSGAARRHARDARQDGRLQLGARDPARGRPASDHPVPDAGRPDRDPRRRREPAAGRPRRRTSRPSRPGCAASRTRPPTERRGRTTPGPSDVGVGDTIAAMDRPRLSVALTIDHDAISDSVRRGDPPVKRQPRGVRAAGRCQADPGPARAARDPGDLVRPRAHA